MTDQELVSGFEACTLPKEQWTHRAHVRAAFFYLSRYGFDQAVAKMRSSIKAFNAHHGGPESPTEGYNETTTHAFMHLIAATMAAYRRAKPTPDGESFCDMHPQLMSKHVLRVFYLPERRMHPEAKHRFIEPDLAPLPRILL